MATKKLNGKICLNCKKSKQPEAFYSTSSQMYPDGKLSLCKTCIKNMIDPTDPESVKAVLRQIDKPFIVSLWTSCAADSDNPVGQYLRQVNSLPQYRGLTWENSNFGEDATRNAVGATASPVAAITPPTAQDVPVELFERWGTVFSASEVKDFEATYQRLRRNYKIQTAQHEEFLRLACIAQVKATYGMASGNTKDAKDYMDMFHKMTAAGKLQPQQFSKADLSDGLDTFGQLVRQVEKTVDVIPTLPRFKERPQDKVDIVLWSYINYVRSLKGLDDATYEDIWAFYDVRKKDYESAMVQNVSDEDEGDS